jgi:hypothetical protein
MAAPYISPYEDEPEAIPDDALLYRRIQGRWIDWATRDPDNRPRLTGGAFQDASRKLCEQWGYPGRAMSVGLSLILEGLGFGPEKMLESIAEGVGLAALRAGDVRFLHQGVTRRPTDSEPWHGLIFSKLSPQKNDTTQSDLAARAVWVIVPAQETTVANEPHA